MSKIVKSAFTGKLKLIIYTREKNSKSNNFNSKKLCFLKY